MRQKYWTELSFHAINMLALGYLCNLKFTAASNYLNKISEHICQKI